MKNLAIAVMVFMAISCASIALVQANPNLESKLTVEISEDGQYLHMLYTVRNLTGNIIAPDPSDNYYFTIRNVATGTEVVHGNLESAFQTNVSQYASPYAHAVFAVKRLAIPATMKQNPGFYLIFLASGRNAHGEETVFYIPANLSNPNLALQEIRAQLYMLRARLEAIMGWLYRIFR